MGINRDSLAFKEEFVFGDIHYGTIRAIVPQDIALLLTTFEGSFSEMFKGVESLDLKSLEVKDSNKLADQLIERGPKFLMALAQNVPNLLARLIAIAADDDAEDVIDAIQAGMPMPVQFAYVTRLCELSFLNVRGFSEFVGNVSALIKTAEALTSAPTLKSAVAAEKNGSTVG